MPDPVPPANLLDLRHGALSRWDDDGEASAPVMPAENLDGHELSNTELIHLGVRVIALKNMMIAVLTEGSDRQLEAARVKADPASLAT